MGTSSISSLCLPAAVHRAAHQGNLRAVLTWLTSAEGYPGARNEAGETVLAVAVRGLAHRGASDIDEIAGTMVKALVAAGVPVNAVDAQGRSALHWAVLERPSIVMALLSVGANPNLRGPNGDTPLHTIYLGGSAQPEDALAIASMLRAMGASGASVNADGLTPDGLMASPFPLTPRFSSVPRARCRA